MNPEPQAQAKPTDEPPSLPAPPRPVTARASRRSWNELGVRVWVVLTLAVAMVCAYFATTRVHEALTDRWLIQNGTPIVAKLGRTDGNLVPKRQPRNESVASQLIFDLKGERHTLDVRLEPRPNSIAMEGMDFPIRVDPDDPNRWTEETEAKPWAQELTVIFFIAPILVLVAIFTLWKRMRVLSVWRNQPLVSATVVGIRQTAVAPLSRVVRFTLNDSEDRRVWSVLSPTSVGIPEPGETIWIVCPPENPARAILARLYT